ncbi:MAG: aldehyde dehydrogenase family protein [Pseudomonadota bacterium]
MNYPLLINGQSVTGDAVLDVVNPANEEVFASCSRGSEQQLNDAVAAAKGAFPAWSEKSIDERKQVVLAMADAIEGQAEELAQILVQEQGKPLGDALGEVHGAAAFFRYFTSLNLDVEIREDSEARRVEAHRTPLGVVGAILPWNFPLILLGFKLPAALIAGNTVVVKPAPTTPLATLRLGEIIRDIVPAGVVNIIADANDLGSALTHHPDVRKVSFTGSTATGKKVMEGAASLLKRITLELGGNDAGIVLEDVNPKEVAPHLFQGAFMNSGQVCAALKRLYVHESIYDEVVDELAEIANNTNIGDGLQQGTDLGPLQNKMQYEKVKEILDEAKEKGTIAAGGDVPDQPGYFIKPTIVRDIKEGARLVDEEQFGPVLPVIKYSDEDDVIQRANDSDWGLTGSVWSSNVERAYALANKIEAGTVAVNAHAVIDPTIPFGGAKMSGIGSELGEEGLKEFTQLKMIAVAKGVAV